MTFIKTRTDLWEYLDSIRYNKSRRFIAVEALIFKNKKLVLLLRGDGAKDENWKLEGIGGSVLDTDEDLLESLQKEIKEEIGCKGLTVEIERQLEIRQVQFQETASGNWNDWVVLSHLCRYKSGNIFNCEPDKHDSIKYLTLDELYAWPAEPVFDNKNRLIKAGLSRSLVMGREVYKKKYGNRPYYEIPEQE